MELKELFKKKDIDPRRNRNRGYKSYFDKWKERIEMKSCLDCIFMEREQDRYVCERHGYDSTHVHDLKPCYDHKPRGELNE